MLEATSLPTEPQPVDTLVPSTRWQIFHKKLFRFGDPFKARPFQTNFFHFGATMLQLLSEQYK